LDTHQHANPSKLGSEVSMLCFSRRFSSYIFKVFVEQSIFVAQKRLVYEKASFYDGKNDAITIKEFA